MIKRRLVDIFQLHNLNISLNKSKLTLYSFPVLTFWVVTCVFLIFQYKNIAMHVFITP